MGNSKNNQHSANQEVLSAINDLSEKTDQRFDEVFEVVTFIKDNAVTKEEFKNAVTKEEFKNAVTKEEFKNAVTKDYLDEKLADLRGDLVVMMRKEDNKLKILVGVLAEKKVLDNSDVKRIYSLEPFAQ